MEQVSHWFDPTYFEPHSVHFGDVAGIAWSLTAANVVVALAYFSLPTAILYFIYRRPDLVVRPYLYYLFAAFILWCGLHHAVHAITMHVGFFYIQVAVDVMTALVSVISAVAVWWVMPQLVALPNTQEYVATKTQLLLAEQEVDHQKQLDTWRSEFLSATSHELRNPLSVINLSTTNLEHTLRTEHAKYYAEHIAAIRRQVEKLTRLVGELSDINRAEGGTLTIAKEPIDLHALVRTCRAELIRTDRTALVSVKGRVRPQVCADPARLEQVLQNLLENAHKYAPASKIVIRLSEGEREARICVRDQGPGIPSELHEKIFERFYRAPDAQTQSGMGVGLFLCRRIIEAHGGRIWVESAPGAGSMFCISIPYGTC